MSTNQTTPRRSSRQQPQASPSSSTSNRVGGNQSTTPQRRSSRGLKPSTSTRFNPFDRTSQRAAVAGNIPAGRALCLPPIDFTKRGHKVLYWQPPQPSEGNPLGIGIEPEQPVVDETADDNMYKQQLKAAAIARGVVLQSPAGYARSIETKYAKIIAQYAGRDVAREGLPEDVNVDEQYERDSIFSEPGSLFSRATTPAGFSRAPTPSPASLDRASPIPDHRMGFGLNNLLGPVLRETAIYASRLEAADAVAAAADIQGPRWSRHSRAILASLETVTEEEKFDDVVVDDDAGA